MALVSGQRRLYGEGLQERHAAHDSSRSLPWTGPGCWTMTEKHAAWLCLLALVVFVLMFSGQRWG